MFQSTSFNQDLSSWNISNVSNMYGMFNSSALSSDNYNLILIGWASKNLQESVSLGAGSTKYCSVSLAEAPLQYFVEPAPSETLS